MKCNYRCTAEATHHAFSTVGAGHLHTCEKHAPDWLRVRDFGPYYAATPGALNEEARRAALAAMVPPYERRKAMREATLAAGRS